MIRDQPVEVFLKLNIGSNEIGLKSAGVGTLDFRLGIGTT